MASSPEQLLASGEKRAAASGGWFSSKGAALEEAIELFKGAGNKFRLANRFEEAGGAFMRAAQTEEKSGEKDFAANTYVEASKCYRQCRPERELHL